MPPLTISTPPRPAPSNPDLAKPALANLSLASASDPGEPGAATTRRAYAALGALVIGCVCFSACAVSPGDESADEDSETSSSGGEGGELAGACALEDRVGLFQVVHEAAYSAIDGEINDAVIPTAVLEETLAEGDCRILQRENPFCDPPCSSGEVCTQDSECVAYPERQEPGDVTIKGLVVPVTMEPRSDKRYFDTTLPHPGFEPGTTISLTSTGGEVGPLALEGRGFSPIVITDTVWTIQEGQPLTVTWTPEDGEASFYMSINIDQHGNSPSTLICESEDDGSLEVPANVIDALLNSGVTGFPMGHAYRRTVDSMQAGAGCVEFQVRSHVGAEIDVVGHTACTSDADCPDGQTCDVMNETCV